MNVTTLIAVPSDGAYFEGHFPGRPILPGVAEIALALEALVRETRGNVALRGIAYARLRQIVVPGDLLELTARSGEGGHLRIDLKRGGILVANGEFLLGAPEMADDAALIGLEEAVPLTGLPSLDELLPHRPPMRFIESILAETADSLSCVASIPFACPLASGGSVPAVAGLEAAAQAAAVWEAVQRSRIGDVGAPRVGYLVALRDVVFFADRIPADRSLRVTVTLEAAALPLSHYRAMLFLDGRPLVRGMIATFLKEDSAHDDPAVR